MSSQLPSLPPNDPLEDRVPRCPTPALPIHPKIRAAALAICSSCRPRYRSATHHSHAISLILPAPVAPIDPAGLHHRRPLLPSSMTKRRLPAVASSGTATFSPGHEVLPSSTSPPNYSRDFRAPEHTLQANCSILGEKSGISNGVAD
ncbi:hypothetical protein ACP70R_043920 [Stipagrostis hirtigluma subsp. patula]